MDVAVPWEGEDAWDASTTDCAVDGTLGLPDRFCSASCCLLGFLDSDEACCCSLKLPPANAGSTADLAPLLLVAPTKPRLRLCVCCGSFFVVASMPDEPAGLALFLCSDSPAAAEVSCLCCSRAFCC